MTGTIHLDFTFRLLPLIIAITGLTFTYEWVGDGIYKTFNFGGDKALETKAPIIDTTKFENNTSAAIDRAIYRNHEKLNQKPKCFM